MTKNSFIQPILARVSRIVLLIAYIVPVRNNFEHVGERAPKPAPRGACKKSAPAISN
ncbi:MAG: hypothetical protein JNM75_01055 [Rhodospirillales bacterium]|nr:hypothetical protein [Rhodospirillales bacterium]